MKQLLFAFMLSLILCNFTRAQNEPLAWIYSEAWTENATNDPANNCISQEAEPGEEPFMICDNARFRLNVRHTVELNPAANAHGAELTVSIVDSSTNRVVSQNTNKAFYAQEQTVFTAKTSHEFDVTSDGTGMGPFDARAIELIICPDTGHDPGGGTIGGFGFAVLSFRFDSIHIPGKRAWYRHRPHVDNWCPSICESPRDALIVVLGNPDPHATVTVPITLFHCSPFGAGVGAKHQFVCFDWFFN